MKWVFLFCLVWWLLYGLMERHWIDIAFMFFKINKADQIVLSGLCTYMIFLTTLHGILLCRKQEN